MGTYTRVNIEYMYIYIYICVRCIILIYIYMWVCGCTLAVNSVFAVNNTGWPETVLSSCKQKRSHRRGRGTSRSQWKNVFLFFSFNNNNIVLVTSLQHTKSECTETSNSERESEWEGRREVKLVVNSGYARIPLYVYYAQWPAQIQLVK